MKPHIFSIYEKDIDDSLARGLDLICKPRKLGISKTSVC